MSETPHAAPPDESLPVWVGACALAAKRHPNASYPQPSDLVDARIVLLTAVRHVLEQAETMSGYELIRWLRQEPANG